MVLGRFSSFLRQFQLVLDGFRSFQIVLGRFSLFLTLVSTSMSAIDRFDCSTNLQTKSTSSENRVGVGSQHVALRKCRIPFKKGIKVQKNYALMFSLIFFKFPMKESIMTASFAERYLKQPCLAHRNNSLNFQNYETENRCISYFQIDAYRIFIKVFSQKSYQFLLS